MILGWKYYQNTDVHQLISAVDNFRDVRAVSVLTYENLNSPAVESRMSGIPFSGMTNNR